MACAKTPQQCYPADSTAGVECTWSTFMPSVIPYLVTPEPKTPRPPPGMVETFIKDAAEDLIESMHLFTDCYSGMLQQNVCEVPIIIPEGRTLNQVRKLSVSGDMDPEFSLRGTTIALANAPCRDQTDGYTVEYSYTLPLDDCQAPPELCLLGSKFKTVLRHRVLFDLYGMRNMPWGSLQQQRLAERDLTTAKYALENKLAGVVPGGKPMNDHLEGWFWNT